MLEKLITDFPEHMSRPVNKKLPLQGIRIIDFTHFIAGPFATMILADMGAEVIKIEAPQRGDDFRQYPPFDDEIGQGAPFLWSNRNKQSLSLDLKTPEGLSVAQELIKSADIVVENFSTGVMQRLGLDYESCKVDNPKLIYCSISAYGRNGSFSDRLGFDPIAQAESGFISMNGYSDREGVRALSPVMDIGTAMMTSNAILGAIVARSQHGIGQTIDISLFDSAVVMSGYAPVQYLFSGKEPQRHGNTSPDTCPSGAFKASDRTFYINCGSNKIFQRLACQVLKLPELAESPEYATVKDRNKGRDKLFSILNAEFAKQPWTYWQKSMREAGVPCGLIRTVAEAIRSDEAMESRVVTRIPHRVKEWVPNISLPIKYSETPLADPVAAPNVGEHTLEVMKKVLGYSDMQIDDLQEAGAFGKNFAFGS
ncbi:MAG: CoA transferase [Alcaligenaceae bacterium]|nr:CoA transferase [Alcaligenaceae bacterium]